MKELEESNELNRIIDPSNWELAELLGYCRELHIPIYAINNIDLYDRDNLIRLVKEDIANNIKSVEL